MSYTPILEDLTALGDELAELGDDVLLGATKAGARNSAADAQLIQEIAEAAGDILDLAIELGADNPNGGEEEEEDDLDASLKAMMDDPAGYAQHECGDIAQACAALQAMAMLMGSELSEGHEDDEEGTISKLALGMRTLTDFIRAEIDAIEGSGMEGKAINYDQAAQLVRDAWRQEHPDEGGPGGSWPQAVYDNAIIISERGSLWYVPYQRGDGQIVFADRGGWQQARQVYVTADGAEIKAQRTFGGKKRADLKDEDFAGPDRTFPIVTAKDVKDAARLIGKADDPDAVKKRIIAIAKRKGFEDAIPEAWRGATKGIEFVSDELAVCPGYSVKAMLDDGDGVVGGYLVKFGGGGDLSQWRDIFTDQTDFGSHRKTDVYVHHRMLPGLGKRKLTNQADLQVDDVGVFMKHLLNLRDPYEKALYGLVQRDKLGLSSGTAPHLVDRKSIGGRRHEVTHWPIGLDGSYTPTPAGGFDVNASALKSIFDEAGIDLLNAMHDATKTTDEERQRAILLELGLLELETA